ncbi:hypothetical protein [Brucella anthropi]|uniref:hypothetical protein n=1 Tax=Brucella anthropi TaxID=529 RepID=UPI0015E466CB|nr:hypothetical protein [Ochrobactrum sp. MYb49]
MFEATKFKEGDTLQIQNLTAVIASVDSDTQLTLAEPWTGADIVDGPYRARQLGDGSRVSTQAATIIELLGNGVLINLAELGVEEGKAPVGGPTGEYELQPVVSDPKGNLASIAALTMAAHQILQTDNTGKFAALTLAARQILQTDATGVLKAVALAANKSLVTDANGDVAPIDLGTLGRTLLALAAGTSAQYVQGDGTLQPKAGLPIGTDTQSALNGKLNTSGGQMSGNILFRRDVPTIEMRAPGGSVGYDVYANVSNTVNGGLNIRDAASNSVFLTIGGSTIGAYRVQVTGGLNVTGAVAKGSGTFLIDHPLDPFNKNLRHGFVEAPRYDLIYRGTVQLVNGRATVDVDAASNMTSGTFAALTTNAVVASLQNQDGFARLKPGTINGGSLEIICEDETCTDLVSWVVIAERNDPFVKSDLDPNTDSDGRFIPEFDKPEYVNEQTEDAKNV